MRLVSFVSAAPDAAGPTVSAVGDQSVPVGDSTGTLAFTVGDNTTPVGHITVTRSTSNPTAVPLANVVLGGSGANRTVSVTGAAGGSSTITLTATDRAGNSSSETFLVSVLAADATSTLTAGGGVAEPVGIATSIDSDAAAVDVLDFTIHDAGTSDGLATLVSQVAVNVGGTSTDTERGKITWRLFGPDHPGGVTGTYNAANDAITFSGLTISVANGGNETYRLNAYFNDNTGVVDGRTITLSVDGDTDLTVGASDSQMAAGQSPVTNGSGGTIDVVATELRFTTQPAGSVSGLALTTQPVVAATDAFGNVDTDFAETISLSEASAGSLSGDTETAIAGVATFTNVSYSATADQQPFTLTANDDDGVGTDLPTVNANSVTSDVVATLLVFTTQPSPTTVASGQNVDFTADPEVVAYNFEAVVDTGFASNIVLEEANGAGSATLTGTGDSDGSPSTVTRAPTAGVVTFSNLAITYTLAGAGNETFNLRVSGGGIIADSTQLTAVANASPSDISLGATSINQSATAAAAAVGVLGTTDADIGDSHTYSLVANGASDGGSCGAAGDDDNASFQIDNANDELETASSLAARSYNVCVQTSDGTASFQKTFAITVNDDVAPTVSSVAVPADATYVAGQDLDFTIATSENVIVDTTGGTPQLSLTIGATTRQAAFLSGSGTSALVFRHTVLAGDLDTNGITIGSLSANGGTLRDAASNNLNTALNSVGSTANVNVDADAPVITSVSVPANATYTTGQFLDFVVNTDENVTVVGTPRLALTVGGTTRFASYNGGTTTSAITFRHVVQAGDEDSDGVAVGSLELDGGSMKDAIGNDLVLTLNGLGSTTGVLVDAVDPVISSVGVPADDVYGIGEALDFIVNTSENVTVNTTGGTPRITVDIGGTSRFADFVSGSGSSALVFRHTVPEGDTDTDGIALGTLQANGGTLRDGIGNDLDLTLNSVGALTQVRVDGVRPTATLALDDTALSAGETATLTITFSEAVTDVTAADLTVENGSVGPTSSSDGGVTWTATLTPAAGTSDPSNVVTLDVSGVLDSAGNPGTGTAQSPAYSVQTVAATASISVTDTSLIIGETSTVTITFSEAVTGLETSDLVVGSGSVGAVSSGDGGVTWTTTLTPTADTEASVQSISLDNALVSTVAGGNPGSGTTVSNSYAVDTRRPTAMLGVSDGALRAGETATLTVTFSEAVTGFTLADLTAQAATLSDLTSSDGGTTWTATLTPTANVTDATNVITLFNTGVNDLAGNAGVGTPTSGNYAIDTQRPAAVMNLSDTVLTAGEEATLQVVFSEAVTGFSLDDLTAQNATLSDLSTSDGGENWTATLTPAANTSAPGNVVSLALGGVQDAAGNTGTGTASSPAYSVQTTAATTTISVVDTSLIIGETSTVTITFSEAVSGLDAGDFTVANGSLSAPSSADGGVTWSATLTPAANVEAASNQLSLANSGVSTVAGGNPGTGTTVSNAYAVDTRRPTASLLVADATLTTGETSPVTITFSEAVSGFDNADLTVPNGTLSAVSSADGGVTWTTTLTPAAGTTVPGNVITLATSGVSDLAGNAGAATSTSNAYAVRTGSFTVGGQIAGLSGSGLVLRNNGADDLAVAANGGFVFATPLADAASYLVSVATQPSAPDQVCTVTRGSGSVSSANVTDVQIDCVLSSNLPSAPRNISGTPGDRQITVLWEAPQFVGGSPITGYLAQAVPQGVGAKGVANCSTTGALSCVVSGLSNGTAYTLQVSASNANGAGVSGFATAPVTPLGVPDAPSNVQVQVSGGQATISWVPPVNTGGAPITSYTVTASPGGQSCTVTGTPPPNSCQIAGLQPGVSYTFTVVARNAAGAGTGGAGGAPATSAVPAVIPVDAPWALGILGFCLLLLTRRQLASRPERLRRR